MEEVQTVFQELNVAAEPKDGDKGLNRRTLDRVIALIDERVQFYDVVDGRRCKFYGILREVDENTGDCTIFCDEDGDYYDGEEINIYQIPAADVRQIANRTSNDLSAAKALNDGSHEPPSGAALLAHSETKIDSVAPAVPSSLIDMTKFTKFVRSQVLNGNQHIVLYHLNPDSREKASSCAVQSSAMISYHAKERAAERFEAVSTEIKRSLLTFDDCLAYDSTRYFLEMQLGVFVEIQFDHSRATAKISSVKSSFNRQSGIEVQLSRQELEACNAAIERFSSPDSDPSHVLLPADVDFTKQVSRVYSRTAIIVSSTTCQMVFRQDLSVLISIWPHRRKYSDWAALQQKRASEKQRHAEGIKQARNSNDKRKGNSKDHRHRK